MFMPRQIKQSLFNFLMSTLLLWPIHPCMYSKGEFNNLSHLGNHFPFQLASPIYQLMHYYWCIPGENCIILHILFQNFLTLFIFSWINTFTDVYIWKNKISLEEQTAYFFWTKYFIQIQRAQQCSSPQSAICTSVCFCLISAVNNR